LNDAADESRLAPCRNSPQCPAPAADDRGLMSSAEERPPPPQLDPLLLVPLLRIDGAEHVSLPASTLLRFMVLGSGVLLKLPPGLFRRGIASFSLNRVRSFFCSCKTYISLGQFRIPASVVSWFVLASAN
jgi:hypothetical protein